MRKEKRKRNEEKEEVDGLTNESFSLKVADQLVVFFYHVFIM